MAGHLSAFTSDPSVARVREFIQSPQQNTSSVRERFVFAVPSGEHDGAGEPLYDYYVRCSCGWWSLPDVVRPVVLHCDACEAVERGRRNFEEFFVPQAGRRGYAVLERREGQQ